MLLHIKMQTRADSGTTQKAECWAAVRADSAPGRQQLKGRLPGTGLQCLQCVVLPLRYQSAPCTQHCMLYDNGLQLAALTIYTVTANTGLHTVSYLGCK
jgi:hypothetical protein